jgi:hypothetical protein
MVFAEEVPFERLLFEQGDRLLISQLSSPWSSWRVWHVDSWCFSSGLFFKLLGARATGLRTCRYAGADGTCDRKPKSRIRELLAVPLIPVDAIKAASAAASTSAQPEEPKAPEHPCPCCGSNMRIIETFLRGQQPKHKPTPIPPKIRIDTS